MSLHDRIAAALGWSAAEVRGFSLQALRDLLRPAFPKLAAEIDQAIKTGRVIIDQDSQK